MLGAARCGCGGGDVGLRWRRSGGCGRRVVCDAIDAEPSDALAVEEFERAIAQHRESPVIYTKFDGMIERIELDEGHLRLHTFEGAPGDEHPHLNGYTIEVVTDWSLDGDQWQATEVSRVDTTPEPEPEPEPEPVPEPEPFVEEGPIHVRGDDGEYLYEVSPEGFDCVPVGRPRGHVRAR